MRCAVKPARVERITLTIPEAQALSGLGRNTLLKLAQTGEIEARRIGKRRWLIMRDSLEKWLRGHNGGAAMSSENSTARPVQAGPGAPHTTPPDRGAVSVLYHEQLSNSSTNELLRAALLYRGPAGGPEVGVKLSG